MKPLKTIKTIIILKIYKTPLLKNGKPGGRQKLDRQTRSQAG